MPERIARALAYAFLIWITGFVWGSIVFITPALKNIATIPYVSRYPAISFPLLLLWIPLAYMLARSYLKVTTNKANEGIKLGFVFAVTNLVLDLLVIVLLFKNGLTYFGSLTVWLAYLILLTAPWFAGRSLVSTDNA
ncbi:MAG TPA: hypothetical protein VK208_11885 [Pyrinomonadaceae bacterium]|jgi:hypothetical protein|nr:hypothetical protein [Pyrinomonadaceae bacterium]